MNIDRPYGKHNELPKHETLRCCKCDGMGKERWLLFFHRDCPLCCGTGKREHIEPYKKYEAEGHSKTFHVTKTIVIPGRKQIHSDTGLKCAICNGTGIQRFTERVARYGALSVSSGCGLQKIVHTSCCTYCQGTGKSS